MPITYHTGNISVDGTAIDATAEASRFDILDSDAEAIVIPVNCVGVMGKGLALQAKERWPGLEHYYRLHARVQLLRPGVPTISPYRPMGTNYVFFPTKDHWRNPSQLEWIEQGLDHLIILWRREGFSSIAVPPLGCGLGGLSWSEVHPLIVASLGSIEGLDLRIYGKEI